MTKKLNISEGFHMANTYRISYGSKGYLCIIQPFIRTFLFAKVFRIRLKHNF